jgi:hypothetical protein
MWAYRDTGPVTIISILGKSAGDKITSGTFVYREVEAGFFGQEVVLEAVAAGGFEGDFGARINEAIRRRIKRQTFHLPGLEKANGVVHFCFVLLAALGLELFELAEGLLHRTVQTLFIDAEIDEGFRVVAEGPGGGESGVNLGMAEIDVARGFEMAHAEHAVFDGPNAVDAPLIVGDRLGELALDRGLRVEAGHDFPREFPVGVHVFRGEDDDARGEAVAQGVHAGAGFAWRGRGALGFFCVETVGCVLSG